MPSFTQPADSPLACAEPAMTISTTKPLGSEARIAAFEATVEHRYADSAGVRTHYAATGAGPLLVLLHGFPDHWLGCEWLGRTGRRANLDRAEGERP